VHGSDQLPEIADRLQAAGAPHQPALFNLSHSEAAFFDNCQELGRLTMNEFRSKFDRSGSTVSMLGKNSTTDCDLALPIPESLHPSVPFGERLSALQCPQQQ